MISHKPTYTKRELEKIRKNLGGTGLSEVCTLLNMKTEAVRVILVDPKRYNETVFDTVAQVLENRKQKRIAQKQRIMEAI